MAGKDWRKRDTAKALKALNIRGGKRKGRQTISIIRGIKKLACIFRKDKVKWVLKPRHSQKLI